MLEEGDTLRTLKHENEELKLRIENQQRSIDSLLLSNQNYANQNAELTAKIKYLEGNYTSLVGLVNRYNLEINDWVESRDDTGKKPTKNVQRFRN